MQPHGDSRPGRVFWSQAVIAEVYTLHAAIVAGVLLALLAWGQTRRDGYFFAAIAVFAAGLGNHTTIVALAPGMAVYALMTDRRFATRARTLATSAAIVSAGILQYAFILIRSHQPGVYLESRATTVRELLNVMLGRQFQDRLFAFEWQAVMRDRLPSLVEHVLAPELTIPGLVLATVGAVWLLRHRLAEGLLLLPTLGIIVGFAANYRVVDTPVFLIPGILVLWVAAARWCRARGAIRGTGALGRPRVQRGRADRTALEFRAQLRGERSQPGHQRRHPDGCAVPRLAGTQRSRARKFSRRSAGDVQAARRRARERARD